MSTHRTARKLEQPHRKEAVSGNPRLLQRYRKSRRIWRNPKDTEAWIRNEALATFDSWIIKTIALFLLPFDTDALELRRAEDGWANNKMDNNSGGTSTWHGKIPSIAEERRSTQ